MFFFKRHKKLLINHFVFKKSVYWVFKKIAIRLYYYLFNSNLNNFLLQTKINIPLLSHTKRLTKYIKNKVSFIRNTLYRKHTRFKTTCSRLRNGQPGAYLAYKSFFSYDLTVFSTLQDLVLKYNTINNRLLNWFQFASYNKLFVSDIKVFKKKALSIYIRKRNKAANKLSSIKTYALSTHNTNTNSFFLSNYYCITSNLLNSVRRNSFIKVANLLLNIPFFCQAANIQQSKVLLKYLRYFITKSKNLTNKHLVASLKSKTNNILSSNIKNTLYYYTLDAKYKELIDSSLRAVKDNNYLLKNTSNASNVHNNALLQFVTNVTNTNIEYNTHTTNIISDTKIKSKGKQLVGKLQTQLIHKKNNNCYSTWVSYINKYKSSFYNNLFYSLFKRKEAFAITYFKIFYNHYLILYCMYKLYKVVCSNYLNKKTQLAFHYKKTTKLLTGKICLYKFTKRFKTKKAVVYSVTNKLCLKKNTKQCTRGTIGTYLHTKKKLVNTFNNFKIKIKHTLLLLYYELQSVVERGEYTKSKANKVRIQIASKPRYKMSKLFFSNVSNRSRPEVRKVIIQNKKVTNSSNNKVSNRYINKHNKHNNVNKRDKKLNNTFVKTVINKKLNNTMVNIFKKYFNYYVTFNTYNNTYYVISNVSKKVLLFKYKFLTSINKKLTNGLSILKLRKLLFYKLLLCRKRITRRRWWDICHRVYRTTTIQHSTNTQFLDNSLFYKLVWALSISTISNDKSTISIQLQNNSSIAQTCIYKISSSIQRSIQSLNSQSSTKLVLRQSNIVTQLYKGVLYYRNILGVLKSLNNNMFKLNFLLTYMFTYYVYNKNRMYRYINNILMLFKKKKNTNKITVISDNLYYKYSTRIVANTYVFSRQFYMFDNYRPLLKSTLDAQSNTLLVKNAVVSYFWLNMYKLSSNNFILATWLLKKYIYKYINKLYLIIKYYIFCLVKSNTLLLSSKVKYNNYSLDILTNIFEYNSVLKYIKVLNNYTHFFKTYSKQTYLIDYIGNSTFISIIQNKTYYYFYIKYYIVTFWYLFYYIECSISKYSKINTFLLISYNLNWEYYLNSAKMWCEYIVFQLKKRITIRKVFWYIKKQQIREKRNSLNYILNHPQNSDILAKYKYPLKGIRILYSGNIKKAKRKQRLYYYVWLADIKYSGGMPVRNLKTYIDYYFSVAVLKRASVGIKFWLLYDL